MGLELLKGQSIEFVRLGEEDFNTRNYKCKGDPREFCQLVSADYETQFQIKVTPDTGEELLTNGTFDTDLTGWVDSGSSGGGLGAWSWSDFLGFPSAYGIAQNQTTTLTQASAFGATIGDVYRIVIDVCGIVGDTEVYIDALDSGGNSAGTTTGVGSNSNPITEEGAYTVMFESSVTDSIDIVIAVVGGAELAEAFVCSISAMSVTLPEITLQDCNGNEIATIQDIVYAAEYATVTVDWTPYDPGCYKICAFPEQDTGENLFNLCLVDELGNEIVDQNGDCIEYRI